MGGSYLLTAAYIVLRYFWQVLLGRPTPAFLKYTGIQDGDAHVAAPSSNLGCLAAAAAAALRVLTARSALPESCASPSPLQLPRTTNSGSGSSSGSSPPSAPVNNVNQHQILRPAACGAIKLPLDYKCQNDQAVGSQLKMGERAHQSVLKAAKREASSVSSLALLLRSPCILPPPCEVTQSESC